MRRGRPGTSVQALRHTIRVNFTYRRVVHPVNPQVPPTKENLQAAERLMARVRREIELDIFDFKRHFPQSHQALLTTFSGFAEAWLERQIFAKAFNGTAMSVGIKGARWRP